MNIYVGQTFDACRHIPGDGCTLMVMADGCSLECSVCHEIIVECEPLTMLIDGDDIEWVE